MLLIMIAGFHPYYLRGEGMGGRRISPGLVPLVLVHGTAMTAWLLMFFVQTLLIPSRKVRVHMKLGWATIGVALIVSVTGFMVAIAKLNGARS